MYAGVWRINPFYSTINYENTIYLLNYLIMFKFVVEKLIIQLK